MNPKKPKSLTSPSRSAAFEILRRVETEGAYASVLIASLSDSLSREDRALAHEIRWECCDGSARSITSSNAMRQTGPPFRFSSSDRVANGGYQLRYLARVPPSAAVSESVNLVKTIGARSASGFVNAVLRKVAR